MAAWWVDAHYYGAAIHLTLAWLTQCRLYYRWGDLAKSSDYAQRILHLLTEQQMPIWRASTLVRLGYAALRQQRYADAQRFFTDADKQQRASYPNELCWEARLSVTYSRLLSGEPTTLKQSVRDYGSGSKVNRALRRVRSRWR